MKCVLPVLLAAGVHGIKLATTPMARVATLLVDMKARIESDGKKEQESYDKYACWCENTLERKAKDISDAEKLSKELQTKITKLFGELGEHGAEIKQLKSDIEANIESQREAKSVRANENAEYEGEKTESEQCIGALEAAIKVLTAGTKGGFLETMKEVELLSVVTGVRSALKHDRVSKTMTPADLTLIHNFLEHPADYVGKRAGSMMSALQIANNPFGDYAPQSTQIQGILRGMYEGFSQALEKSNAEEANSQKAHEELMRTKQQELETLQATLSQQEQDNARKLKDRDTSTEQLDDTKAQLKADEEFFAATKAGCKEKAQQWAVRSRLRTEELTGVGTAIGIMTSPEAVKVFHNSTTTFVQVSSVRSNSGVRSTISAKLARLALQAHSFQLANLAVDVRAGGHFDHVIASIDKMIASLRQEEQDDISHRDRCQRAEDKNSYDKTDLGDAISKADTSIQHLQQEGLTLQGKITALEGEIEATRQEMKDALDLRNGAVADFRQALKDDTDAVALLDQTLVALAQFYKNNRIAMNFFQKADPEYTVDKDKAPETSWADEKYVGRREETHGLVEIIRMIKEDVEKEIKTSKADNDAAEAQYEKERGALQDTLDAQLALKASTERELGETEEDERAMQKHRDGKDEDLTAEKKLETAIYSDCSWVAEHFESRRTHRQAEIEGLIDAKGYLGGAEDGSLI